jgi:hypothetical protein
VLGEAGATSTANDLALSKLATNIVEHGFGGAASHRIALRLEQQGGCWSGSRSVMTVGR